MDKTITFQKNGYGCSTFGHDRGFETHVCAISDIEHNHPFISMNLGYCWEDRQFVITMFHHKREDRKLKMDKFIIEDVDLDGMFRILKEYKISEAKSFGMGDQGINDHLDGLWT